MRKSIATVTLAAVLTFGAACETRSPQEVHPTHGGPGGECIEWDDEPCDDDPFDADDDDGVKPPKPRRPTRRR